MMTVNQAQSTCNDTSSVCTPWVTDFDTLDITGYPGCLIICEFRYRVCTDNLGHSFTETEIRGFREPAPSIPCNTLLDHLWIPYGDELGEPDWDFIQHIFIELGLSHAKKVFLNRYNSTPPEDKWKFECPNIETKFVQTWSNCSQIGIIGAIGPFPLPWVILKSCNDALCCRRVLNICWDTNANSMVITENWEPQIINCYQYPDPIPGAIWSSTCLPWCGVN